METRIFSILAHHTALLVRRLLPFAFCFSGFAYGFEFGFFLAGFLSHVSHWFGVSRVILPILPSRKSVRMFSAAFGS